jgi:colanic acid/amylovoran biosynthesis protein
MSSGNKRVLILGACYGSGNMGVDALLSGTIASIYNKDPETEIALLDFGRERRAFRVPAGQTDIEVRMENLRFSWKLWMRNNGFLLLFLALMLRVFPLAMFRRWCFARYRTLEMISEASRALSLAGGDSFSDIYGFQRLLYVCLPQYLVLAMGCPLILLPQTLGPFKSCWARGMARLVMVNAAKVYSRDLTSLQIAGDMLGENAGRLAYSQDMAFALEPRVPKAGLPDWAVGRKRPLVGLNVSGLLFMGGYNQDNMFGLKGNYPELMRTLIRWFTQEAKADLLLVTHVTGWENDANACKELHAELSGACEGRLHLADPECDHREIKWLIGHCDFFLGARMHACIAALSQGVPAIGMAYSRKFAGVFDSVEVPELVADLRTLDTGEVMKKVIELYGQRDLFASRLHLTAPLARRAAEDLYGELADEMVSESRIPTLERIVTEEVHSNG